MALQKKYLQILTREYFCSVVRKHEEKCSFKSETDKPGHEKLLLFLLKYSI